MTIAEYFDLRKAAFDRLKRASPGHRITLREQLAEIDLPLSRAEPADKVRASG